jgi:hypothetical protein
LKLVSKFRIYFQLVSIKTLLKAKGRISFRGSFVKSKEKHLKQEAKISNLKNASRNLIYIPLTNCKKTLKRFSKRFAKTKQVVQAWSKMLNKKSFSCGSEAPQLNRRAIQQAGVDHHARRGSTKVSRAPAIHQGTIIWALILGSGITRMATTFSLPAMVVLGDGAH